MKTVRHYSTAREKTLHVETDGGIVNIRVDLIDRQGHKVTSIQVIPDDDKRGGDGWGHFWDLDGIHNSRLIRRKKGDGPYVNDEHRAVLAAAQKAVNAATGDSNDDEIQSLQEALDAALHALGLTMPEPEEGER